MKTVLIIEDETQTRNIFLKCLEFEGFCAVGACNGTTGMAMAQTHQPDLVVCDIMMPDIDGYSVLSALRQNERTASIPFIFLTAKVTMADLRQGMELGADDYLTKPCSLEQFLTAISTRLQRQEQLKKLYVQTDPPTDDALDQRAVEHQEGRSNPEPFFPRYPALDSVFHFIEAHYNQPIHLDDVAQEVGYSPAYLTTLMQEQTGHTVKQWIIERRMAEARMLLVKTQSNVRKIAQTVGYSDAGYFSRHFRKLHGVSPQVWRQESVSELTNFSLIKEPVDKF